MSYLVVGFGLFFALAVALQVIFFYAFLKGRNYDAIAHGLIASILSWLGKVIFALSMVFSLLSLVLLFALIFITLLVFQNGDQIWIVSTLYLALLLFVFLLYRELSYIFYGYFEKVFDARDWYKRLDYLYYPSVAVIAFSVVAEIEEYRFISKEHLVAFQMVSTILTVNLKILKTYLTCLPEGHRFFPRQGQLIRTSTLFD